MTVVAFDLGTCNGVRMYQAVAWPSSLHAFDPGDYSDLCTGRGVGTGWRPAAP